MMLLIKGLKACSISMEIKSRTIAQFSSSIAVPLVSISPLSECEVCVIVPVCNEAATLWATLSALNEQYDLHHQRIDSRRYEVIVFANNCCDGSAAIAREFAQSHPSFVLHIAEQTLPSAEAYIGRVRQMLMDEAYQRLISVNRRSGIIASTDGDSYVTPTWIAAIQHEIAKGADAVGGRIMLDRAGLGQLDPYAKRCHLQEVSYRSLIAELEARIDPDPADPFPRHFQHYGASLAVTAQMYAQAGGMPAVRSPEDVAFYQALVRSNARFRHSPLVKVITSARRSGRATQGLANQLNEWSKMGQSHQPYLVESAAAVLTRLESRCQLRSLWHSHLEGYALEMSEVLRLAEVLGVSGRWLIDQLLQPCTFGDLFEQIEQQQQSGIWAERWQRVRIETAIAALRSQLAKLRS
jgi:hypothetical protein